MDHALDDTQLALNTVRQLRSRGVTRYYDLHRLNRQHLADVEDDEHGTSDNLESDSDHEMAPSRQRPLSPAPPEDPPDPAPVAPAADAQASPAAPAETEDQPDGAQIPIPEGDISPLSGISLSGPSEACDSYSRTNTTLSKVTTNT